MKKILLLLMMLSLVSCGDAQMIRDQKCDTYGFITEKPKNCKDVEYRLVAGSLIWSVILVETILAPILILGYDMYEPVPGQN